MALIDNAIDTVIRDSKSSFGAEGSEKEVLDELLQSFEKQKGHKASKFSEQVSEKLRSRLNLLEKDLAVGITLRFDAPLSVEVETDTIAKLSGPIDSLAIRTAARFKLDSLHAIENGISGEDELRRVFERLISEECKSEFFGKSVYEIVNMFRAFNGTSLTELKKRIADGATRIGYSVDLFHPVPLSPLFDISRENGTPFQIGGDHELFSLKDTEEQVRIDVATDVRATDLTRIADLYESKEVDLSARIRHLIVTVLTRGLRGVTRREFNVEFAEKVVEPLTDEIVDVLSRHGLVAQALAISQLSTEDARRFEQLTKQPRLFVLELKSIVDSGDPVVIEGQFRVEAIANSGSGDAWHTFSSLDYGFSRESPIRTGVESLEVTEQIKERLGESYTNDAWNSLWRSYAINQELVSIESVIQAEAQGEFAPFSHLDQRFRSHEDMKALQRYFDTKVTDIVGKKFGLKIDFTGIRLAESSRLAELREFIRDERELQLENALSDVVHTEKTLPESLRHLEVKKIESEANRAQSPEEYDNVLAAGRDILESSRKKRKKMMYQLDGSEFSCEVLGFADQARLIDTDVSESDSNDTEEKVHD